MSKAVARSFIVGEFEVRKVCGGRKARPGNPGRAELATLFQSELLRGRFASGESLWCRMSHRKG